MESLAFCAFKTVLSANNNNFSFPLWVSFVFFFCCCYLIVQPRTEVAGAEILALFLVFHEQLQPLVFTTTVLAVGLLGFIVLKYIPSIHKCLCIFSWNNVKLCLMLLGFLFYTNWDNDPAFILCLYIELHILNHPCITGIRSIWSYCMLECVLKFSLLGFFGGGLWQLTLKILVSHFLSCRVTVWLWEQDNADLIRCTWVVCPLQ